MTISVLVRSILLWQNRAGIDNAIEAANNLADDRYVAAWQRYSQEREAVRKYEAASQDVERASQEDRQSSALKKPINMTPKPPKNGKRKVKMLVVLDDSKVITMIAQENLMPTVFAGNPEPPRTWVYTIFRWIGWLAFAVHIISIGMSKLATQIYTVVVLAVSTILLVSKIGCDDSRAKAQLAALGSDIYDYFWWEKIRRRKRERSKLPDVTAGSEKVECWISSTLKATCSDYPSKYDTLRFEDIVEEEKGVGLREYEEREFQDDEYFVNERFDEMNEINNIKEQKAAEQRVEQRAAAKPQTEAKKNKRAQNGEAGQKASKEKGERPKRRTTRRQDLYVWLNLKKDELESMKIWDLFPHVREGNREWWEEFNRKKRLHKKRLEMEEEARKPPQDREGAEVQLAMVTARKTK